MTHNDTYLQVMEVVCNILRNELYFTGTANHKQEPVQCLEIKKKKNKRKKTSCGYNKFSPLAPKKVGQECPSIGGI